MFCVYAAETFRRRHAGGPWKWETVFAEIEHATPDYQSIYAWVEKGLRHFNRPLLKSRIGRSRVSGYPRLRRRAPFTASA